MSVTPPTQMTFFERFEADILSGKKTITLRDESESDYLANTYVEVKTLEEDRFFCRVKILAVEPVRFAELNDFHAKQENMTLPELKAIIQEIYPGISQLYMISYELA
ncbi:hypothetical protein MED121_16059 [Marinomonas sp. MED121]|uniref:N(4)-acetylcytidine aminohydrolase n=1 Tax=Marinomonas sp. MED121 TaxID=314277 RepID=UPI0000691121|nr:N(4)-acetylcytidine aminohydrolase [Marinomonas sp. MED121]EAQ67457.1 hypothetical protein MED121_16059 [Marinomonas sp. MED121]